MPALPTFFRSLVKDGPLPLSGATASAFARASARDLRTIADQGVDLLGDGMGTALLAAGLTARDVGTPLTADAVRKDADFKPVLAGDATVKSGSPRDQTKVAQRLIQAVAARVPEAPSAMALGQWGADGGYGAELKAAIKAAQKHYGLEQDGVLGSDLASQLVTALGGATAPDLFAELPPEARISAGAAKIAAVARELCAATGSKKVSKTVRGRKYTYTAATFGVPATHNGTLTAPGNVSYGLRTSNEGYWKCNIFGGVCIALAELPVPAFHWSSSSSTKHFFRAERFGPKLAKERGWAMVTHLDHRDPDDHTQAVASRAHDDAIQVMLDNMLPGDLFLVDHPGDPGNNGGHTRVCVGAAKSGDPDHAPLFAQASHEACVEKRDGMAKLGGTAELQFWVVRYTG